MLLRLFPIVLGACALAALPAGTAQAQAPAAEAERLVEGACTGCHSPRLIAQSSGYTREGWDALTASMIALPAEPKAAILDYLAARYPPAHNPRPATPAPGSLRVQFTAFTAPQLGQRARDPVEAPDGAIWWVGQSGNTIGRLDPAAGAMREWPLPQGALPHSVNIDPEGGVWYMGNGNGTIGKFDPATGQAQIFPMPDPRARDPHTAEFDGAGLLWFTLQQSNMIGRLDPRTGKIDLASIARPRARPYGIKIAADGAPWVACNGSNCLLRIDPATMAITEIDLPGADTHVRRLDIAPDGAIWYVNSGRGRLGRYDPKSGAVREWDSPSGPRSHPYAIAIVDGVVWYNESGVRPDMLVRFDPAREAFQSWPVPSGPIYAGIVRHMRATRAGKLALHQSSTNRILLADLPPTR